MRLQVKTLGQGVFCTDRGESVGDLFTEKETLYASLFLSPSFKESPAKD